MRRIRIAAAKAQRAGDAYERAGRFELAMREHRESLVLYEKAGDPRQADLLNDLGIDARNLKRTAEAETYFRRALARDRILRRRLGEAHATNNLGLVRLDQRRNAEALSLFRTAYRMYVQLGSRFAARSMHNEAAAEIGLRRYSDALRDYRLAFQLYRRLGERSAEGDALRGEAAALYDLRDYAGALAGYRSALASYESFGRSAKVPETLNDIADTYDKLDRSKDGLAYHRRAATAFERRNDRAGLAEALYGVAIDADNISLLDQASTAAKRSAALFRALGNVRREADVLHTLAGVYTGLDRYDDGIRLERMVAARQHAMGNRSGETRALIGLARALNQRSDYEAAIKADRRALAIAQAMRASDNEADALQVLGEAEEAESRYADARRDYLRALEIFRARKSPSGEALALKSAGDAEEGLSRYEDAMRHLRAALSIERDLGEPLGQSEALSSIAIVERDLDDYPAALRDFRAALALDIALRNRSGIATDQSAIADVEQLLDHNEEALRTYRSVLPVYRALGRAAQEAETLSSIANVQYALDRYAEARKTYEQALAMSRSLHERGDEADALDSIGDIDYALGRYDDALRSYRSARTIYEAVGDPSLIAQVLLGISDVEAASGRYDDALRDVRQAHSIYRRVRSLSGEGDAVGRIASIEDDLGRYRDALRDRTSELGIRRRLRDGSGEASALIGLGNVERSLDLYDEDRRDQERALKIYRALKMPSGEASCLNNIGTIASHFKRYDEARDDYLASFKIDHALGNRPGEAISYGNLASIDATQGHYPDARREALEGAALASALGAPALTWRPLRLAALSERHLGLRDEAIRHYDAAIAVLEGLRGGLDDPSTRSSYIEDKLFVYDEYIEYLLELAQQYPGENFDTKALRIFEKKQARAFLEEIGRSSARRFSGVPPAVTAEERRLAERLARLDQSLSVVAGEGKDASAIAALRREDDAVRRQVAAYATMLRTKYGSYYRLTHPEPAEPAQLEKILQPGERMLIYAVLPHATALWIVDADSIRLKRLEGGTSAVNAKVASVLAAPLELQQTIDDHPEGIPRDDLLRVARANMPAFTAASYSMFDWLIPPSVRGDVMAATSLMIVPTGALYKLPWEALVVDPPSAGAPHYLLERHDVSYLSSASLLTVLRQGRQRERPRYPIVAFADPAFGAPRESGTRASPDLASMRARSLAAYVTGTRAVGPTGYFSELRGTADEAKGVIAVLRPPPESHPLYLREDASRSRVLQLQAADCSKAVCLKNYRYVLFATHAVLPDEVKGLLQPALVLAHPERPGGFLTMGDAFALTLNADIVSLSACNTGSGIPTNADGVRGLTQAFMYAGAPVVAVNLWEVSDIAAARLTPAFYAGLHGGRIAPAEALHDAKAAMAGGDDELLRHPYFWATTVLFGDGDAQGT